MSVQTLRRWVFVFLATIAASPYAAAAHLGMLICEAEGVYEVKIQSAEDKQATGQGLSMEFLVTRTISGLRKPQIQLHGVNPMILKRYPLGGDAVLLVKGNKLLRIEPAVHAAVAETMLKDCT